MDENMKTLAMRDLQQTISDTDILNLLVQEGKIGQHEADFYLAMLSGITPGDIASTSQKEMEEFMRLHDSDEG